MWKSAKFLKRCRMLFRERTFMKMVTAIVKPMLVPTISDALLDANITGMTAVMVANARGFGKQKGHTEIYSGAPFTRDLIPKSKIQIVVEDKDVKVVKEIILKYGKSGKIGDGLIFVTQVESFIDIRTGKDNSK